MSGQGRLTDILTLSTLKLQTFSGTIETAQEEKLKGQGTRQCHLLQASVTSLFRYPLLLKLRMYTVSNHPVGQRVSLIQFLQLHHCCRRISAPQYRNFTIGLHLPQDSFLKAVIPLLLYWLDSLLCSEYVRCFFQQDPCSLETPEPLVTPSLYLGHYSFGPSGF